MTYLCAVWRDNDKESLKGTSFLVNFRSASPQFKREGFDNRTGKLEPKWTYRTGRSKANYIFDQLRHGEPSNRQTTNTTAYH